MDWKSKHGLNAFNIAVCVVLCFGCCSAPLLQYMLCIYQAKYNISLHECCQLKIIICMKMYNWDSEANQRLEFFTTFRHSTARIEIIAYLCMHLHTYPKKTHLYALYAQPPLALVHELFGLRDLLPLFRD